MITTVDHSPPPVTSSDDDLDDDITVSTTSTDMSDNSIDYNAIPPLPIPQYVIRRRKELQGIDRKLLTKEQITAITCPVYDFEPTYHQEQSIIAFVHRQWNAQDARKVQLDRILNALRIKRERRKRLRSRAAQAMITHKTRIQKKTTVAVPRWRV